MRNPLAEWILSLVASKDRAAMIVGDLLEADLGSTAFWFSLVRAAVSIGVHRPRRFLSIVFLFAIDIGGYALWIWVFTREIGVSLLLAVIMRILLDFILARLRLRRRRSALPEARRTL